MSTETCLYVTYRNLCIECSKGSCGRGSSVSMYKHYIRTALFEDVTQASEHTYGHIGKILTLFHDIEVIIRLHIKDMEYLVEHFTMLPSNTYDGFKLV